MRQLRFLVAAVLAGALVFVSMSASTVAQQPRRGGTLNFIVNAEPPSFDAHREATFALIHPARGHYNLLVKFDPQNYPKVVPDLAESWSASADGRTYTFKIRRGVRFHDGSTLTARDIKATYEKIIFPKGDVVSARQATYEMVERIESPDANTVVFRLKWRSPSFLQAVASPWNWIYKAEIIERDPHWYERNVMGTGPFKFVEYVRGSHWAAVRNENYWVRDRPYLDGYRALFITNATAAVNAIKSGQALVEFRGFSPTQRDDIVATLGNRAVVQESNWICNNIVVFNTRRKPFDDARFRKALSLAVDRWGGSEALSRIAFVGPVGGATRPGGPFATPPAELEKLAGYSRDISAARAQARRLLAEAGVPEGFEFNLLNRNIQMPYSFVGVFLIDQWRQVGLRVTHVVKETGPYLADERAGNFDAAVDFNCDFYDDPDLQLVKFLSVNKSPLNYGGYNDSILDRLYTEQSRSLDAAHRIALVRQFERRLLDDRVWQIYVLWWKRIIPHSARLHGYKISPSHYLEDYQDVWVSE
ncbi:MAG TPA: ABC transporter substrate-binding protein [bacterium]|jgi:peptide/nickel transport system substrate-binding protein|nr:ABC transporter substrate-binding protein [bacterium]